MKILILLLLIVSCGKGADGKRVETVYVQTPGSEQLNINEQEPTYPKYKGTALNDYCIRNYNGAMDNCLGFPVGGVRSRCIVFTQDDLENGCPERSCRDKCATLSLTEEQKFRCHAFCFNN